MLNAVCPTVRWSVQRASLADPADPCQPPPKQSDLGPHGLPLRLHQPSIPANARSRRLKQTTLQGFFRRLTRGEFQKWFTFFIGSNVPWYMFTMDMKFYTYCRIPKHGEMSMLSCSSVNIMMTIIGCDFVVSDSLYCWYLSTVKLTQDKAFNVIIMAAKRLKDKK